MFRAINFAKRNFKEILRDPLIYVFCIGFPVLMLVLFQVIEKYTAGNMPIFNLNALVPAIIMFSFTFVMLITALLVSKDRQTFFLKRLYSSPMKPFDFIFGYFFPSFIIGLCQGIVCLLTGGIIALVKNVSYINIFDSILLIISQLPILIFCVFLGILFGVLFNDKTAPGICSIFITLSGMLGGCWMPIETMGGFETFCKFLPFYPSVYLGRVVTSSINSFGNLYTYNLENVVLLIPIVIFLILSIIFTFIAFKESMVSDK